MAGYVYARIHSVWQDIVDEPEESYATHMPRDAIPAEALTMTPAPATGAAAPVSGSSTPNPTRRTPAVTSVVAPRTSSSGNTFPLVITHVFGRKTLLESDKHMATYTSDGQKALSLPTSEAIMTGSHAGYAPAILETTGEQPNCYLKQEAETSAIDLTNFTRPCHARKGLVFDLDSITIIPTGLGKMRRLPKNAWMCMYSLSAFPGERGHRVIFLERELASLLRLSPTRKARASHVVFSASFKPDRSIHFTDIENDLYQLQGVSSISTKIDTTGASPSLEDVRKLVKKDMASLTTSDMTVTFKCPHVWMIPDQTAQNVLNAVIQHPGMNRDVRDAGVFEFFAQTPPFLINQIIRALKQSAHRESIINIITYGIDTLR